MILHKARPTLHDRYDATFVGNNSLSSVTLLVFDNQNDPNFPGVKEININVYVDGVYEAIPPTGSGSV